MTLRRQLPAWSPLSARALGAGLLPASGALERVTARIEREYGASAVALTASGTVALALAFLASARAGQRPRIALPAWGCYDLMTAADTVDAEVTLYDLDPGTLGPDPESFGRVVGEHPDAMVVAHWYGVPVDLEPLVAETREAGTLLIDDAAQGVGAYVRGGPAGAGGDLGVLSFGRGKGRTGGCGGAVFATSSESGRRLRTAGERLLSPDSGLKAYAALWVQYCLGRPGSYWLPANLPMLRLGETVYRPPPALRSLPKRAAAVVGEVWDLSLAESEVRRAHGARWEEALEGVEGIVRITGGTGTVPGWLRYPVLAAGSAQDRLRQPEARRSGIMPGYPTILAELPFEARRIRAGDQEFPGARRLAGSLFTLPTHRHVRGLDFEAVRHLLAAQGSTR